MLAIFVVSDASGETAQRMVQAALVQFHDARVEWVLRGHVTTPEQIRQVVAEAASSGGIVFHTLVSEELRRLMLNEARRLHVDAMDLIGPPLERLSDRLELKPLEQPGLLQQMAEAKSRQIAAVEFAFLHDDGRNLDDLGKAEVVLVGISRTMKTPIMLYLAYREWMAANVPLVPELPLSPALLAVPPARVLCVFMDPARLRELRLARARDQAIPVDPYASPQRIREELNFAQRVCQERRWRRIDVTGRSVEEIVREIVALLPSKESGTA